RDVSDRLGAAHLPPDLMSLLLAERPEIVVERRALRQMDDGADVLALDVERPAFRDLAPSERGRERIGGWIAATQPPQVDDVPWRRMRIVRRRRGGEMRGESFGDLRQGLGRGEDRRVIGV